MACCPHLTYTSGNGFEWCRKRGKTSWPIFSHISMFKFDDFTCVLSQPSTYSSKEKKKKKKTNRENRRRWRWICTKNRKKWIRHPGISEQIYSNISPSNMQSLTHPNLPHTSSFFFIFFSFFFFFWWDPHHTVVITPFLSLLTALDSPLVA